MDRNIHHMNENYCTVYVHVYLYFSKAFDSLNYDILLSKLTYYGLQQNVLRNLNNLIYTYCYLILKLVFITLYIKDHCTIRMFNSIIIIKLLYYVIFLFITTLSQDYVYSIYFFKFIFV